MKKEEEGEAKDCNVNQKKMTTLHITESREVHSKILVKKKEQKVQLVERGTGTPLTQVRFPGAARDFFSQGQLSVQTLTVSVRPRVQSHALTSVCTLKIL